MTKYACASHETVVFNYPGCRDFLFVLADDTIQVDFLREGLPNIQCTYVTTKKEKEKACFNSLINLLGKVSIVV